MTFEDLMGKSYLGNNEVTKALYEDNRSNYAELVRCLKMRKVIPLFGAGFSGDAYPGWENLLRGMAIAYPECKDEFEQLLQGGHFEEAASLWHYATH